MDDDRLATGDVLGEFIIRPCDVGRGGPATRLFVDLRHHLPLSSGDVFVDILLMPVLPSRVLERFVTERAFVRTFTGTMGVLD